MAQDSKTGAALVDVDQAALRVTLDVIGMVSALKGLRKYRPI